MSKYGTPWALICLILAVLLVTSYSDKWRTEDELESLQTQLEELESALSYAEDPESECEYCGSHNYTFVFCDQCDTHFPDIFSFNADGEHFCPLCYRGEFKLALSSDYGKCDECCQFYERKWGAGYGLCEDCGDEILGECDLCYRYDRTYVVDVGYNACIECLQTIITEMNLESYIDAWKER